MTGPLSGFRVIDLGINVLGPLATQHLGDMGADIIKVEAPDGDPMRELGPRSAPGMSAYFVTINRNKRSIVLNLKDPLDHEVLLDLVRTADVFFHSMRAAAARRLKIDYHTLSAINPKIVYASSSGFRMGGRYEDRPAFDDVIQGESGIPAMIGRANGEPRYLPMAICDKLSGLATASAVSMALLHRERTGRGQEVHLPMYELMLSFNLVDHMWNATFQKPEQGVGYPRMFTPHRRPLATRDGYICLLAHIDEQWRRLFQAMERPELFDDPRFSSLSQRTMNIDALYTIVAEEMKRRSTAEWLERLTKADIPVGPMNTLEDLMADPYLVETGFFEHREHPVAGPLTMLGIPQSFSDSPGSIRSLPPMLGEHTNEILGELGRPPRRRT
jgi:crotonobetainyl-CoA:carnitine CoA-transferase CaiB-like acyl-CoA transferase